MSTVITAGNATNGLSLSADNTGSFEFKTGAGAGTTALTIDASGNVSGVIKSGTTVASTSGTSINFTGIPSTAKRITVMFQGVSTSGTSIPTVQLGTSGGVVTTGYIGTSSQTTDAVVGNAGTLSVGFDIRSASAASIRSGVLTISLISGNTWVASGVVGQTGVTAATTQTGGYIALAGTLDRVRITTVGGTDTFDAGSINILYE
jgi:hypothetical protein